VFRGHVGCLHFVLFRRARLFDLLLRVVLLVVTGVIFVFVRLRQRWLWLSLLGAVGLSWRDVLVLLASVSSSFLSFRFVRSGAAGVGVRARVCGPFGVLLVVLCGFVQAGALNLGVLPMIVHPAPRCGCHCF